jgi:hypothetical protein
MCRLKEIYSCLSGGWNNKMSIYCNMLDVDTGTNYQCRKNTKCRDRFRDLDLQDFRPPGSGSVGPRYGSRCFYCIIKQK